MKIRSIFYHLKQGFKNIYRNRLFSLASIATITACVFLFGVFYSIMMNFEYMVKKAENEVCVTVFFDEGLSDTEIKKLGDTISNRVEVSSVHYTSAEEAWNNFKSEYFAAYPDLAEGFKDNPLINSASYEVYLSDAGMQGTLVTYLENLDGVRQVNRSEATASGLSSAAKLVGYVAIAVIIILLAVSIFLITNTIVIGITVRKEEISIMKFIGATDAFVNAPFFVEGIAIGIIGAIIPIVIFRYMYQNVIAYVLNKFSILNNILAISPGIRSIPDSYTGCNRAGYWNWCTGQFLCCTEARKRLMNNKVLSQESHEMTLAWHLSFLGRNIYPDGHSRLRMEESMAHRRIKRGISVVLILFMLVIYVNAPFGNGIRAFGDTVTDLNQAKDKQDQLSSQYEDTKKQLEQLQQESADTKSYIEQLDGKMSTLDSSLQSLNTQIEDMQNQIEEARVNLEQAEIDADVQYDSMKLRIQFMYERNEDTYLDILLSSSSLADLLNKADYITKISEYDRQKLQEYEETIQYIEQTKQNLESDYAELDTMKISLEDQKSALALVQQAKEQELAALSTQTTQTASTKAQLEKEMQEQENEILNLVAKKQQEDAAAKKAEKEKKNQNSSSGQNSNSNINSSSNSGNSSTPSSSGFIWPTVSKRITSPFGDTEDRSSPHKGLDIGAVSIGVAGDPIYASASGTVIIAKYSATAGNYITIDHGNGFSTVYMHCSALKVSVGDTVTQGQTIGLMGTTGNSNGVHLHFAMIKNGTYVNPQSYL